MNSILDNLRRAGCADRSGCWRIELGLAVFILASCATGCNAQQDRPVEARGKTPTFESLPHRPLPRGFFRSWCGNDRVLMVVDAWLEVYDTAGKSSKLATPPDKETYCGSDGQKLIVHDGRSGRVSELDISSGEERTLASYTPSDRIPGHISFSPDLKSVASNPALVLAAAAKELLVIQISSPDRESVRGIQWSSDSSQFFVVTARRGRTYTELLEIFDTQNHRISSRTLPSGLMFRNGWFADPQSILLELGSSKDESAEGFIFRCTIENWKCLKIMSDVENASLSDSGTIGTVRGLGLSKGTSSDGDSQEIPPRYSALVQNRALAPLMQQVFSTSMSRSMMHLALSPSGTKAILTWASTPTADCRRGTGFALCEAGILVDLSGRNK
jgi:hypothetical protein